MITRTLRIGTRDSRLALWQAEHVQSLLKQKGIPSELVAVKSEGDLDLVTPLYAMGTQGVFTKTLDAFLLSHKIDIAVHSMKDVPTQLAKGIARGAVLPRASYKDLLVYKDPAAYQKYCLSDSREQSNLEGIVATGSVRRKAQLLHRFPKLTIENLRGNVQTRMQKLHDHNDWEAAIFAAAGLERIDSRPDYAVELDWMLPAPAQGAIMIVCRQEDAGCLDQVRLLNDELSELCTGVERDFLKTLMGGCATPISALAEVKSNQLFFRGNIVSPDGKEKREIEKAIPLRDAAETGILAGKELLEKGAAMLLQRTGET